MVSHVCCRHKKSRLRPATAPRAGDLCSPSPESPIVGVWPRHSPPFAGKMLGKFRNKAQSITTPILAGNFPDLPPSFSSFSFFLEKTERRLKKWTPEMGSSRRYLRNGAHLCPFCHRSTPVKAGQRRSKLVNAGQSWSTPVNEFWKIAFPTYFRCSRHVYNLRFAICNLEG
ncbi:hypothetical protein TIFTF001_034523 [Ficus carica]|uniref:Uncharacterized protein n=1 Tax=Ficus carica TaxID=3494 RepID=A0AA88J595_FICCA|nr:hypothetical protein TIFTF001_034523 [Ficus carica]